MLPTWHPSHHQISPHGFVGVQVVQSQITVYRGLYVQVRKKSSPSLIIQQGSQALDIKINIAELRLIRNDVWAEVEEVPTTLVLEPTPLKPRA